MSCVLLVAYTVFTEVHDIYRFEFTYKLPNNLELNSNGMKIIWAIWYGGVLDKYTQIFHYIVKIFIILNTNFKLIH